MAKTKTPSIPATQNTYWGFWGTIENGGRDTQAEWNKAFTFIKGLNPMVGGVKVTDEEIRGFLDSKGGRHLADGVIDTGSIEAVHAKWPIIGNGLWFFETIRAFRQASW
jgi:hypothetical protein